MKRKVTSDVWWKNAVIYCLDVETFLDGDGDGCGDLVGLGERLDYLAGLGIDCMWLMPFMPSRQRDDGYDITDFYGVDPRLGTHGDLVEVAEDELNRLQDDGPPMPPCRATIPSSDRDASPPSTTAGL